MLVLTVTTSLTFSGAMEAHWAVTEGKCIFYLISFVDPSQIFKPVVIFFSSCCITVLASLWGLPISVALCSICCQLNSLGETGNHGRMLSKVNIQQTQLISMIKWYTKHISLLILFFAQFYFYQS